MKGIFNKYKHDITFYQDNIDSSWHDCLPWKGEWCSNDERWLRTTYADNGLWFRYGRIDVIACLGKKIDKYIPAIWLLNLLHKNHKPTMEIDVVEMFKGRVAFSQWWHYDPHIGKHRAIRRENFVKDLEENYHTYSVVWKKRYILWMVDNIPRFISFKNIPDEPMAIVVNDLEFIWELRIRTNELTHKEPR